jgi:hypothetical protein
VKRNGFDTYVRDRYAEGEFDQVWAIDPESINIATATSGVDAESEEVVLNKQYIQESKVLQIMETKKEK